MIFFGWGRNSRSWALSDGRQLSATWTYFHFFWFPIKVSKATWHLLEDKRSEDRVLTYPEVRAMFPHNTPHINVWHKYGLLFGLAVLILAVSIFG